MKNINNYLKIFSVLMLFVFMFSIAVFAEPDISEEPENPSTDEVVTQTVTEKQTSEPVKTEPSTENTSNKVTKPATVKATTPAKKTTTAKNTVTTKVTTIGKSSDSDLKKLEIEGISDSGKEVTLILSPVFKSDIKSYTAEAPDSVVSVRVNAELSDKNAKLEVPEKVELQNGDNIIKIVVTAEDGNKKTYEINVKFNAAETTSSEPATQEPSTAAVVAPVTSEKSLNTYTKLGIVFAVGGTVLLGISIYLFFRNKK